VLNSLTCVICFQESEEGGEAHDEGDEGEEGSEEDGIFCCCCFFSLYETNDISTMNISENNV